MENKNLTDELTARADKVQRLQANGELAYKAKFDRTHKISELASLPLSTNVKIAGRVVLMRNFGKLIFAQIYDIEQTRQISLSLADVGKEQFDKFVEFVDIGDFIGVEGKLYNTQKGELTVQVTSFILLGKALRGLPEKFHGLTDTEARFRQKYLDFISNSQSRRYILARFKLLAFLRDFYKQHGFIEVETPILQNAVTGAMAKPFETFHNALDMKMNLRISPEISLKTALAAGFDRVFEVAKNFRNEGLTTDKLQEFTMIESYAAYWDFEDSIEFYSKLFRECVKFLFGEYKFVIDGQTFDVSKPFKRVNYTQELSRIAGFDILTKTDPAEFAKELIDKKLLSKEDLYEVKTTGGMIDLLYKRIMRPSITEPTILYSYPNLIPLVRFNDEDPRLIDMFQLVICGRELVKGYSELVNPEQQKKNFEAQLAAKKAGDGEAMDFDKNYLLAMEHGIPPCSGIGFGIDVFLMTLMNIDNIRDTLLFPLVKPVAEKPQQKKETCKYLQVSDKVFEKVPELNVGVLVLSNVDNRVDIKKIFETEYKKIEKDIVAKFGGMPELATYPLIAKWREIYKSFGEKKARSSVEALIRRVAGGKGLGSINPLVDLYNLASLKFELPAGGENLDKMEAEMQLTIANGDEQFLPIGAIEKENPNKGEIVYKAGNTVVCRNFNYRESDITKLTEDTKNAIIVFESVVGETENLNKALDWLGEKAKELLGAEVACRCILSK